MYAINKFLAFSALSLGVAMPMTGLAQANMDHSKMTMSQAASMTTGEVRKIDKDAGKLTIKHGEIKSLDMPPMTMVFTAKDKAMLDTVKVGEKVRFMVVNENGKMVVTDIQPVK
jgi:Cu(I)/Ag(I) efflux system protein CusF